MPWGSEHVPTLNAVGTGGVPPTPVALSAPPFVSSASPGMALLVTVGSGPSMVTLSLPPLLPSVAATTPALAAAPGVSSAFQMVTLPPSIVATAAAAFALGGPAAGVIMGSVLGQSRHYAGLRGLYRVFDDVEYRFYRSSSGPPVEDDTPFATSSSLPHTPSTTFGDGTWYVSVELFNGVLRSGFLPLGPNGETYIRIDISSGAETGQPPVGPNDWQLVAISGGIVRILALCFLPASGAPEEWAIAYTTNGTTPPTDSPDITVAMPAGGIAVLEYSLPAQSHGTTVKVRLQTRRDDSGWVYSEDSYVLELTIDSQGPTAPLAGERWPGRIEEGLPWA